MDRSRQHRHKNPTAALTGAAVLVLFAGCNAVNVDVGTEDPIKLDPIKIDVTMNVDVNHHTTTKEEQTKSKNASHANERLRNRMAEIQDLKNNRLIGENHLGLLSIRNLPGGDYGAYVQKTVDEENADRSYLMTGAANERDQDLRLVQFEQWKSNQHSAYEGEWVEVEDEVEGTYRWEQKS